MTDAGLDTFGDETPCPPVVADSEAGPVVLASALDQPYGITVDSENIYVATASSVFECPLAGCCNSMTVLGARGQGIVVASGVAYWSSGDITAKDLKTDAGASTLYSNPYGGAYAIATNGTTVYWLANSWEINPPRVLGCAAGDLDGGTMQDYVRNPPADLVGSNDTFGLAATSGQLFFAESRNGFLDVGACPESGCGDAAPTALAATPNGGYSVPDAIVADGTNVYFTRYGPDGGSVLKCNTANCVQPTTMASGLAGGLAGLAGLALDAVNVYWANQADGTIMKCSVSGCPQPIVVASGQNRPYAVAVDSTSVYWTNQGTGHGDGAVMKAPK